MGRFTSIATRFDGGRALLAAAACASVTAAVPVTTAMAAAHRTRTAHRAKPHSEHAHRHAKASTKHAGRDRRQAAADPVLLELSVGGTMIRSDVGNSFAPGAIPVLGIDLDVTSAGGQGMFCDRALAFTKPEDATTPVLAGLAGRRGTFDSAKFRFFTDPGTGAKPRETYDIELGGGFVNSMHQAVTNGLGPTVSTVDTISLTPVRSVTITHVPADGRGQPVVQSLPCRTTA